MSQGYISQLAPWTSGAGVPPNVAPPTAGFISYLGFWTSGAGIGAVIPPPPPPLPLVKPVFETFTVWSRPQNGRRYRIKSWATRIK